VRLLVVDDDTYVRIVLAIEVPGAQLIEAGRMSEVAAALDAGTPDAVIVDRRLPDADGLEVVRRLRRTVATYEVPIIVLTAGYDPEQRAEALRAGADEYLAKPIDGETLGRILEHLASVSYEERRLRRRREAAGRPVIDLRGAIEREVAREQKPARGWRSRVAAR
jgi:DNA-binding response OmpR family regulator